MILITISTGAFPRLVKEMDRIAPSLREKVVMQIGNTAFEPKNCEFVRVVSRAKMEFLFKEASLIVTHAGAGSIIMALSNAKPCVVVPRLKEFSEQIDDHQIEIAEGFSLRKNVVVVKEISELAGAIKKARTLSGTNKKSKLIKEIDQYLSKCKAGFE
tara:strand:+ start:560 stop:1033 length:474 start_codon:yes stop_codon:yes gene_type:complete